jgi:LCP family protein required for cell wall assembly
MQPGHNPQAPVSPFGPVLRGGRPRNGGPNWRLLGMMFLCLALSMTVGLGAAAGALVWTGNHSIARKNIAGLQAPQDLDRDGRLDALELNKVTTILNILVVGSDSREGLTPQQLKALGTRPEASERTDTIILVQLDPRRNRAALLSFPRDLLVTRCDGSRGRINEAYPIGEHNGTGGPDCLVQTIRALTGIPIDHFVRINLLGFINVVDAVGGVSFYLDHPLKDRYAGLDLPAGCVTLDGARAVGFVRARHVDSDFGRIARQQRFIRELVRKSTTMGTFLQPQRLFEIVRSVGHSIQTDQNLGLSKMWRIAATFRNLTIEGVTAWTVPAEDRYRGHAYYAIIRQEEAEALFRAFRTGEFPQRMESPNALVTRDPRDVAPLQLRHGSGAGGLASAARRALVQHGFTVSVTLNATSFDLVRTKVVYPPDQRAEAELAARALGGVALAEGDKRDPITVIIGADFNPLTLPPPVAPLLPSNSSTPRPVAPAGNPQPTPAPTMSPPAAQFTGAMDSKIACS